MTRSAVRSCLLSLVSWKQMMSASNEFSRFRREPNCAMRCLRPFTLYVTIFILSQCLFLAQRGRLFLPLLCLCHLEPKCVLGPPVLDRCCLLGVKNIWFSFFIFLFILKIFFLLFSHYFNILDYGLKFVLFALCPYNELNIKLVLCKKILIFPAKVIL